VSTVGGELRTLRTDFEKQAKVLLESAVHLAVVPDQGARMANTLDNVDAQVGAMKKLLDEKLETLASVSEESNVILKACRDSMATMQITLNKVHKDLLASMDQHASEHKHQLTQSTTEINQNVTAVHELLQKVSQMLRAKMEDLNTLTDEYGDKTSGQLTKVDNSTAPLRESLKDVDGRIGKLESAGIDQQNYLRSIHSTASSHSEDMRVMNAMFEKLKRRVEKGDPMHLSTQVHMGW